MLRGKTAVGGSSFEGQYREGTREGSGSLRVAGASPVTFFGMFDAGGAVGRCVITRAGADAASFESEFKGGAAEGTGLLKVGRSTYKGAFLEGKMSGKGLWSDGSSAYDGEWLGGVPHGQGTWRTLDDVELYEGSFVNGQREGQGRHVCKGLGVYNGSWLHDLFHGFGVFKYEDGQVPPPPHRLSHSPVHASHARCRCTTASGRRVGGTAGGASRYLRSRSTTGSGAEGGCGAWARISELQRAALEHGCCRYLPQPHRRRHRVAAAAHALRQVL